jgi:hypothetical protein
MKRVAFTYFRKPGGKQSTYRMPLDELPKGAEPVGEPEWRDLPEPGEEPTSGKWVSPSGMSTEEPTTTAARQK